MNIQYHHHRRTYGRALLILSALLLIVITSVRMRADTGTCGGVTIMVPFNDVTGNFFFCQIAAAYFSGLTNGTTATTYTPGQPVPREQMAAFVTRTLDQSLKRGSRRAALGQWWTGRRPDLHRAINVGTVPAFVASDGHSIFVSSTGKLYRVSAHEGSTDSYPFTDQFMIRGIVVAGGYVFLTGILNDTSHVVRVLIHEAGFNTRSINVGNNAYGIAFDGEYVWTANNGEGPNTGSVSRVSNNPDSLPQTTLTFTAGFNQPIGILYDGENLWVTDNGDNSLKRVDPATGAVLQTIPVGTGPGFLTFDGTNLWIPCFVDHTVRVVRAVGGLRGTVLATLTDNGLFSPHTAAFDGERILVTNFHAGSVSLWKASDLTPIGSFPTGAGSHPTGVCSDGINFWIALEGTNKLLRY